MSFSPTKKPPEESANNVPDINSKKENTIIGTLSFLLSFLNNAILLIV